MTLGEGLKFKQVVNSLYFITSKTTTLSNFKKKGVRESGQGVFCIIPPDTDKLGKVSKINPHMGQNV